MNDETKQMVELYKRGLNLREIGEHYGITRQAVYLRFKLAGIKYYRQFAYLKIDKNLLTKLYSDEKRTIADIAEIFSVNIELIEMALKKYEIPKRRSLTKGGYAVDFLSALKQGEEGVIKLRGKFTNHLHSSAKRIGIRISVKSTGADNEHLVTRID